MEKSKSPNSKRGTHGTSVSAALFPIADHTASNREAMEELKSSDSKRGTRGTSVSAAHLPMKEPDITQLRCKKIRDVYTKVYAVHSTIFSIQTGQFPTRSQQGGKYNMVMIKINSSAVLVEPLTSRKDLELTRAYRKLVI